jgi:hypothetical protein
MGMTIVRERNQLELSGVSFYFIVHEVSEQERHLRWNGLEERDKECHRRGKLSGHFADVNRKTADVIAKPHILSLAYFQKNLYTHQFA